MNCPCDKASQEDCAICNDQKFSGKISDLLHVIWEQKSRISKLEYDNKKLKDDNEVLKGKLHIIGVVMG